MQRFDPGIPPAPDDRRDSQKERVPPVSIGHKILVSLPPAGRIWMIVGPIIIDVMALWVTYLATASGKLEPEILKWVIATLVGGNLALRVRKQGGGGFVFSILGSLFGRGNS